MRSGAIPVGVLVSQRRHLVGGRAGFEEQFNVATWARDPEDLLDRNGARWRKEYPQLDGKTPRPKLESAVGAKWGAFKRARERDGEACAIEALGTWLSEVAEKHRRSWEHDGTALVTTDQPERRRAIRRWEELKQRGVDVGPFEPWLAKHGGNLPPLPAVGDDVVDPEEVAKLLGGIRSGPRPKVGRLLPAARAPSGGVDGSGAVAEPAE